MDPGGLADVLDDAGGGATEELVGGVPNSPWTLKTARGQQLQAKRLRSSYLGWCYQ